jgi:uncharacterized lipoprotein YmbA
MKKILSILVVVMLAFSGCASTEPTRFYLLSPEANPAPIAGVAEQTNITIVIGAIRLPEYLKRSQIVTRLSENELDRWAEPLERNFTQVLTQNIEQLLHCRCTSALATKLPPGITHRIEVDVVRMDGILGQKASLEAWWSIYTPEKKILLTRRSSITQPVKGRGYEAFVQAQSKALFDFSREIATAIGELGKN